MKTKELDLSKPPPNCPHCSGEREWSSNKSGIIAACYFCGRAEKIEVSGTPDVLVVPVGTRASDSHGFDVKVTCDNGNQTSILVLRSKTFNGIGQPDTWETRVSWAAVALNPESTRRFAEGMAKAAALAARLANRRS